MNKDILALVSQGEQSHIAVLLAQRHLDRLQREVAAAQSNLASAEHSYSELALSVTTTTGLARPAFDDLIQKRVTVLVDLGLIGDIEITTTDLPSAQPTAITGEASSTARVSATPAPNNPYGEDQPRSRSAYQKGYDDGIAGQEPDLNLYKRPSAQEAYLKGHKAGVEGTAEETSGTADAPADSVGSVTSPVQDAVVSTGDVSAKEAQIPTAVPPAEDAPLSAAPAELTSDTSSDVADFNSPDEELGSTTAPAQDEAPSFSPDGIFMQKARAEGAQTALAGEPLTACPYVEGPLRQAWEGGYHGALDQRLEQMTSPETELLAADHGTVVVLETASSLSATNFAQSGQPDASIFDDEDPFGPAAQIADHVTIVSQDNLEIPPFLRRESGVH
ncbi:hypothetical protein IC232_03495 [Microvirga sp. BT688]|uniref:ribosome modulation factor n=1 Tax=Microvirga sp. TaxID=1873136 RepID=UPI00168330CC|nr:Rmf/CrpP family protein [Microvirga sp.]MBD2745754.1 hypothetical protein [Microvirga sp.]